MFVCAIETPLKAQKKPCSLPFGRVNKIIFPRKHGIGDDMSSWRAGAEALDQPTVCSNKN